MRLVNAGRLPRLPLDVRCPTCKGWFEPVVFCVRCDLCSECCKCYPLGRYQQQLEDEAVGQEDEPNAQDD